MTKWIPVTYLPPTPVGAELFSCALLDALRFHRSITKTCSYRSTLSGLSFKLSPLGMGQLLPKPTVQFTIHTRSGAAGLLEKERHPRLLTLIS